ncbi:TIGR04282 family arsenosugar biosynthesis glycosyltransferase [Mangrovihabitans endophyticus]|uniref:Glycosyltransferase n=1 Tax=Mangrovihabitans endophyticus TaxID=1751298 RepID=A0A8J3BWF5_9ACTN|nr:DUF2064 domain-containing protein [Mangrovihabitans endophyticus]GGK80596.1 hypothetical protein GCM10012284_13170 [Mangrovihabitans endophyticus]
MIQLIVVAKAPVPGRVKTRLCPPCTPEQAAAIAAASLADTLDVVSATPVVRRTLLLAGDHPCPDGWHVVPQRGTGLAARLANGFADSALRGVPSLLIGMDTPQVTTAALTEAANRLGEREVLLGPACDGGWWALGLTRPADAAALRSVPMSSARTGAFTLAALSGRRCGLLSELRDVDTAQDARAVAALCPPDSRFARAVNEIRALREAAPQGAAR